MQLIHLWLIKTIIVNHMIHSYPQKGWKNKKPKTKKPNPNSFLKWSHLKKVHSSLCNYLVTSVSLVQRTRGENLPSSSHPAHPTANTSWAPAVYLRGPGGRRGERWLQWWTERVPCFHFHSLGNLVCWNNQSTNMCNILLGSYLFIKLKDMENRMISRTAVKEDLCEGLTSEHRLQWREWQVV